MRLHPAVEISMPRYVLKEGAEIDGKWYPAGTVVGVNTWVVHHDKGVFGEDADDLGQRGGLMAIRKLR